MRLLYNGIFYTLDREFPVAEAAAIDNGRIVAVGETQALLAEFGSARHRDDLGGKAVIPGLCDAHIHLEQYALGLQKVDCETTSRSDCLLRVAERASFVAPGAWILGHGWNQNSWPEGFGNASLLDEVAPHHPVYLTAKSLHAGWANSLALRMAGIGLNTPDPDGGRIGRDEHGNPTGILYESAMGLISGVIPEPGLKTLAQAIGSALKTLAQMGITAVHDFDRRSCFSALQILHDDGLLHQRVLKSIPLEDLGHAIAIGLRSGFGDDFLRVGSVKAFADGALGPRTAAMLQPYDGDPDNRGMLLLDAEELFEHGRLAVENGFSLAVHAIGDRANHEVLEAFSALRSFEQTMDQLSAANRPRLRHRIEHVQLIHVDDAPRLSELGIVASMQPIHATSDMLMADRFWGKRAAQSYAWRLQRDHGAVLAFGSDAPVESPNPFLGIHAAITRQRADGTPGSNGWYPSQRLSLREAFTAYTQGPAYTAGMEDRIGKLSPGYLADLVVLSRDPFEVEPAAVREIHPLATMTAGEWIYVQ